MRPKQWRYLQLRNETANNRVQGSGKLPPQALAQAERQEQTPRYQEPIRADDSCAPLLRRALEVQENEKFNSNNTASVYLVRRLH